MVRCWWWEGGLRGRRRLTGWGGTGIRWRWWSAKSFPRDKTCGDGLTPRAIAQMIDMGFDFTAPGFHRITGLRSYAGDKVMLEMSWPEHSRFPDWGGVIRRRELDQQVADLARGQGVDVLEKTEARPLASNGLLQGVELRSNGSVEVVHPKVVIVADGALNRFGRRLGVTRRKDYPLGLAARGYYLSPRSSDPFLESQLDIRDASGATKPGYGWVFPLGDGTVNVGVGLLSTFKRWKQANTTRMMADWVEAAPGYWDLNEETRLTDPVGGALQMSFSRSPLVGPNWMVIGDAAAAINPWNGEGIAYAYETGRIAADLAGRAVATGDPGVLLDYPHRLEEEYGLYYRTARVFVKLIGRPAVMRTLAHVGLRNRPLMEWTLKVMANLLDEDERGIGEQVFGTLQRLARALPAD